MLKYLITAAAVFVSVPAMAATDDGYINWDGPYVGVNIGLGGSRVTYPATATIHGTPVTTLSGEARQSSSGVLGGAQIGYNMGFSGVIIGAEADIAASDVKSDTSIFGSATGGATGSLSASIVSRLTYLGTVRARLGMPVANGRFMPYVTGGFAYGKVKTEVSGDLAGSISGSMTPTTLAGSQTYESSRTGWTLGGGADVAITPNLSFRAEYLYVDLGRRNMINSSFSVLGTPVDAHVDLKFTHNIVRAGLNYRF